MTITLNGWQRLWVLVSGLYLVSVIAFVALEFPKPENVSHTPALLKQLSSQSRSLLVPEDKDGWQNAEDWGTDVEMPNGSRLSFKKGVPENDMSVAAKEYWAAVTMIANERRLSLVGYAALWWFIPCFAVYIIGWTVGWVYRGFRSKRGGVL